jgi:hypothetical protein
VILVGIIGYFFVDLQSFFEKPANEINSFEECIAAGYPIMESYPEQCKIPDGTLFTKQMTMREGEFGNPVTLRANEQVKFSDNLVVTLVEINDSRCKPDVVCIWAGELSPRFMLLGGTISQFKEIRLGTVTAESSTEGDYTITLNEATESTSTITLTKAGVQVACTMEAKLCSDGSYVGRTGPNCEFTECPKDEGDKISLRAGQREGSLLVEKIYSDYITGLNFMEYPVARDEGFPITLRIGESASNGCTVTLTLIGIQGNTATFIKKTDFNRPCPICLALNTLIDTPLGAIPIQELQKGAPVWTTNKSGERVLGTIMETSKVPVPLNHRMVELTLDDGRTLLVSPLHPTTDGRTAGILHESDLYDGARVVSTNRITYSEGATYDILPSGETGLYFANGILLDSTLH